MLTHPSLPPAPSRRAVVLGAAGFIGSAAVRALRRSGAEVLALGRAELDLLAPGSAAALGRRLRPDDALVFVSARAPCKHAAMLVENLRMAETVCAALKARPVAHLLYVSSDAVYRDSEAPLTEGSCAEPASIHGAMHLAREVLLRAEFPGPCAILRPTLVYGANDPHNGYGPNRFRRLAAAGGEIVLFGEGEERRDHVSVDDVGELAARIVRRGSTGVLNAVSGEVVSFRELAEFTAAQFPRRAPVRGSPRSGPMPHGGCRAFDASALAPAFPDFRPTPWRQGLAAACASAAP
ncbi:MAG TPA: NAD(P)-dependent oxidoreductase [Opitutaceae bacterium]|jgi:nucleoside-diphosphate-sugar epimerase|nr:NAD(P)-dependent oxidoreductase [Opitutaceae bacterium]